MLIKLGLFDVRIQFETSSRRIRKEVTQALNDRWGKVGAVKRHRELTGSSLKEAVDYVNALMEKPVNR